MLGEKIRMLRQYRGLNIDQLAAELSLTQSTLGKYERSEREPDYATIIKIADYFNVSIDWLLDRVENPNELSCTDIDAINLLKYNNVISSVRKTFEESDLKDDVMFDDLLETIIKHGFRFAIEVLKSRK